MTFKLNIQLGNAEMVTGQHVAVALRKIAERVELTGDEEMDTLDPYDRSGNIRDGNGNTVGKWEVR